MHKYSFKYRKKNTRPKYFTSYGSTELVKNISTKEINANRTYFKEWTWEGVTVRVGDLVVWDWYQENPNEERVPLKVKAIFRDKLIKYHSHEEFDESTIWLDVYDRPHWLPFKTIDGREVVTRHPVDFESLFLHCALNFRVVKK